MKMILLGAPGAGKGTQADIISKRLSIPTISTGNILRAAVKNSTPIGIKVKTYMDSGTLVPDELILGIMTERLQEPDCATGYILDGVPRTLAQAEAFEKAGIGVDVALEIKTRDQDIVERMGGRRTCLTCGATYHVKSNPPKKDDVCDQCAGALTLRKDDQPETVKNRLVIYHHETEPLIEFYKTRGKLKSVANMSIEETSAAIFNVLGI